MSKDGLEHWYHWSPGSELLHQGSKEGPSSLPSDCWLEHLSGCYKDIQVRQIKMV